MKRTCEEDILIYFHAKLRVVKPKKGEAASELVIKLSISPSISFYLLSFFELLTSQQYLTRF